MPEMEEQRTRFANHVGERDDKDEILELFNSFFAEEIRLKEERNSCFQFGKYKGKKYEDIAKIDPKYCEWILKQSYTKPYTADRIKKAMASV